jgi:acetoin utilization protein AcuB
MALSCDGASTIHGLKEGSKMKQIPMIQKFMTAMPHTVGKDIPLKSALNLMREYQIRHLPVQDGGRLVGILTDRDLKLAASFQGSNAMTVEDVMTPDPFTVRPDAPVNHVALEMAEHKYGCAIVEQRNGKVVGIFTATDGLRVLAETLAANYKPSESSCA